SEVDLEEVHQKETIVSRSGQGQGNAEGIPDHQELEGGHHLQDFRNVHHQNIRGGTAAPQGHRNEEKMDLQRRRRNRHVRRGKNVVGFAAEVVPAHRQVLPLQRHALCSSKETEKEKERLRTFDSHIPEHLRPKVCFCQAAETDSEEDVEDRFDREERERKKRFEGFGLVGVKAKDDEGGPAENPYELSRKPAVPVYKKPEHRRPLTEEEKQAKLREMQKNAAWREAARSSNLKRARLTDEKEEEEDMKDKAPSFIRSQLNSAASDLTVEQRLQSNKKSLQRSHGFMEKKFTSK
ncbi:hypothetical protein TELCIR_08345, partial [Teladorsagia circumcincta]